MLDQKLLTNCDKEPIHIAGAIQPVGFLLLIDPERYEILMQVGDAPEDFINALLSSACPPIGDYLQNLQHNETVHTRIQLKSTSYGVRIHNSDGNIIVEAIEHMANWSNDDKILDSVYEIFDQQKDEQQLYQAVCEYIKQLTDYERVMLYRFEKDDHGVVIGEAKAGPLESYLFHHFPASDIPVQARALYVKNRVRFIADVEHQPLLLDKQYASLDLTSSILRAVSPVHIEYLKNMDVKASMSISIVVDNKLWGLIACHDRRQRTISVENLKSLQLLSHVCSREFMRLERESYYKERETKDNALNNIYTSALLFMERSKTKDVAKLVLRKLLQIYDCDNAIMRLNGEIIAANELDENLFRHLSRYLENRDSYVSESFEEDQYIQQSYRETLAGAAGIRFDIFQDNQLWLYRKEVSKTIVWAGNPAKNSTDGIISPRKSFESWEQIVKNQSAPWSEAELYTISHLLQNYLSKLFGSEDPGQQANLVDGNSVSMIVTDPNKEGNPIIHVNEAFERLYGYTAEDVVGHNPRILHTGQIDEQSAKRFRKAIKGGTALSILVKNYTKNGEPLWIMNNINPVYDANEKLVYFVGAQFNISSIKDERNESVAEHKAIEDALNTQNKILVICDGQHIKYVNQRFLDFFGYHSLQEFSAKHEDINDLFIAEGLFYNTAQLNDNQSWIDNILKLSQKQRVVGMLSKNLEPHSFKIDIVEFDSTNYLVTFTDISADMEQQISLLKAVSTDQLTGANNRQYFENNISRIIKEANRSSKKIGIIMADIDHFKQVNDTFGHAAGDEVLKAFVNMLKLSLRTDDWVIRWGGEEFIILTLVQKNEDIKIIADNLRERVSQTYVEPVGGITASFGAALMAPQESIDQLIGRADKAMYQAKQAGRNRVELS